MHRVATRRGFLALAASTPLVGCSAVEDVADAGDNGGGTTADDGAPNAQDSTTGADGAGSLPKPHGNHGVVTIEEGRTGGHGIRLFVGANAGASTPSATVIEYEFTVESGANVTAAVLTRADYAELSNGVVDATHDYHLLIEDRSAGRARGTLRFGEYALYFWTPRTVARDENGTESTTVIDFEYSVTYRD